MDKPVLSRRAFLAGTAATAAVGLTACAHRAPGKLSKRAPNETVHLAAIGAGGQAKSDINGLVDQGAELVAVCDVDEDSAAHVFGWYPDVPKYKDYRIMLEKEKDIDAVMVTTPDHNHAPAALRAMALGKAVYVQKPLTHSIYESRLLLNAAREHKVVTQMGNQGHAMDSARDICEMIWDGAIGEVEEAYCWTNRPIWPQGIQEPLPEQPVPDTLDWDLWIGPAPMRPYNEGYAPFTWRGWWDFGAGALGDMACHVMDPVYWSLGLGAPTYVECVYEDGNCVQSFPNSSIIRYQFPKRKVRGKKYPPVTLCWYDGGFKPPLVKQLGIEDDGGSGSLFVGSEGYLGCGTYSNDPRLYPEEKARDYRKPAQILPRIGDVKGEEELKERAEYVRAYKEFIDACKGLRIPGSNFEYAAPFTEMVLLGNIAIKVGQRIHWDSEEMRITNLPEANQYVRRGYRDGWF